MNLTPAALTAEDVDKFASEISRQYEQYLELAKLARIAQDDSCYEQGVPSAVGSFVVGFAQAPY